MIPPKATRPWRLRAYKFLVDPRTGKTGRKRQLVDDTKCRGDRELNAAMKRHEHAGHHVAVEQLW